MTKQVQRRRGTAAQHTSFTGAEGEISVNTTNKSVHVHDGATAGGIEAARADLANVSDADLNTALSGNTLASLTITSADINGGTIDGTVIGGSTPAAVTGTTITGTSFVSSGDMTFGDSDKAIFGAGSDLQIYHDGSGSYVSDQGVGPLNLLSGGVRLKDTTDTTTMLAANAGGAVTLYYDNAAKLATTATGVDVTGTITSDGLTVDGTSSLNGDITMNTGTPQFKMYSPSSVNGYDFTANVSDTVDGGLNIKDISGKQLVQIKSNNDISFYEDTGTTPKFFWDASAEALGIGTSSPSATLTVGAPDASAVSFVSNPVASFGGGVAFDAGSGNDVQLINYRTSNMQFGNGGSVDMTINSSGNVGIGTSSPTSLLHTSGTDYITIQDTNNTSANIQQHISLQRGNGSGIDGRINTVGDGSNGVSAIAFAINGERMRIDSSGNVGIGTSSPSQALDVVGSIEVSGGIYLGGTTSANLLDDYEEGTWTVEIYDASTGGNVSATTVTGYYTKVGRMVTASASFLNIDTTGMTSGNAIYLTLPFTNAIPTVGSVRLYANVADATVSLGVFASSSATRVTVQESRDNAALANVTVGDLISGASDLAFSITYQV